MKNKYLQEAIAIGNQLLTTADHNEHGLSWETAAYTNEQITWETSETIYSGTSGIVLFLIELSKQTSDDNYLHAAEKAMQWVEWYCKEHPTTYYAFFTGRLGVSFAYLKLYEATKKKIYKDKALAIAKNNLSFLEQPNPVYELINGFAGTLLGLLHLHAATNEPWILEHIAKYVDVLMKNAKYATKGIYWDTDARQIRPLCGLSHGTSGIGFVFLELSHYFDNPAFFYIAEQAFAYENHYYDRKMRNWPDFRLRMYTPGEIAHFEHAYQNGNLDLFTQEKDMNAWCHGAAGIGLSRLRATQLLSNKRYATDLTNALQRTRHSDLTSSTLCHGNGGNADLFIESYRTSREKTHLLMAEKVGNLTLKEKETQKKYRCGLPIKSNQPEDLSLFNGIAGIGYFLLRLAKPDVIPSILAPTVATMAKENSFKTVTNASLRKQLITNVFPKTVRHSEAFAPQKSKHYFTRTDKQPTVASFISFVKKLLPTLPRDQQKALAADFAVEVQKRQLQQTNSSSGLLFIKEQETKKLAKTLLAMSKKTLIKQSLLLAPEVKMINHSGTNTGAVLLKLTPYGVDELPINDFCSFVLQSFAKQTIITSVIDRLIVLYKPHSTKEKTLITQKSIEQIKEALTYGILLPISKTLDKKV